MTVDGGSEADVYDAVDLDGVVIIRGAGELTSDELAEMASLAASERAEGKRVLVDLRAVTHLHYAGARHLRAVPGIPAAVASRYVKDLVLAGGAGGYVELFDDVEDALRAA